MIEKRIASAPVFLATKLAECSNQALQDPNTANEDGVAPIILAAHYGHLSCVVALCNSGADINLSVEVGLRAPYAFCAKFSVSHSFLTAMQAGMGHTS